MTLLAIAFGALAVLKPHHLQAAATRADIVTAAYAPYLVRPPSTTRVTICHGYGCRLKTDVDISAADRRALAKIMAAGEGSPAAERRAIGAAGVWFDRRIAGPAGTRNHVAESSIGHIFNSDGQFDCIDASRNMTTLLLLLEGLKLLRFHHPDVPVARGYLLDLQFLPHATAVATENATGKQWAVDFWVSAYGQPPEIIPLARWEAGA